MNKEEKKTALAGTAQWPRYDAAAEKDRNTVGEKIREARKRKGLSIAAFSERMKAFGVDVSVGGAGKWELGYSIPNAYQLIAICSALDIEDQVPFFTESYVPVLNDEGMRKVAEYRADLVASGRYRPAARQASVIRFIDMPVSDLRVSAGTGSFLDEGEFEMVSFPEDKVPEGADFGVRVSGDSMEPVYHDGQIVWVQECGQVAVGQVGVFIYDGEGFLKMYSEQEPDGEIAEEYTDSYGVVRAQPVLESYNRKYGPRVIMPDAVFRVVGRVL